MAAPRQIGVVQMEDGRELRISLTTERRRPVLDVREFAFYKPLGLMTPNRNGVVVPVEHMAALLPIIADAIAAVGEAP